MEENKNLEKLYHQTVKKVTNDFETLNFNTAISQMMIFINAVYKENVFNEYVFKDVDDNEVITNKDNFINILSNSIYNCIDILFLLLGIIKSISFLL